MPDYSAFDALADVGGTDAVPDRTPFIKKAPGSLAKDIPDADDRTHNKEQINMDTTATPSELKDLPLPELVDRLRRLTPGASAFPRTVRRDQLADVLREHYGPEVEIVDAPLDWMPGAGHSIDALGITNTEYVATARLIARVTDCTVGDASGQLDLVATVLDVTQ